MFRCMYPGCAQISEIKHNLRTDFSRQRWQRMSTIFIHEDVILERFALPVSLSGRIKRLRVAQITYWHKTSCARRLKEYFYDLPISCSSFPYVQHMNQKKKKKLSKSTSVKYFLKYLIICQKQSSAIFSRDRIESAMSLRRSLKRVSATTIYSFTEKGRCRKTCLMLIFKKTLRSSAGFTYKVHFANSRFVVAEWIKRTLLE